MRRIRIKVLGVPLSRAPKMTSGASPQPAEVWTWLGLVRVGFGPFEIGAASVSAIMASVKAVPGMWTG